ncbi:hypothetical protein J132_04762 [Termitomyces sp. J132]|nr:hypothetical protein J132_04762 [Termitomyces sp. J132]
MDMVRAALVPPEELLSMALSTSVALTEEGLLLSVALATTNPATSSGASSDDAPSEESMELDYANNLAVPTSVQPVTTSPVVPSPSDADVATNIATLAAPETVSNGSSDTANAVSECWADIMSNKEAAASKMDE